MAGGRPTDYDPAFCEMVVDSMSAGYSKTATAGKLGVTKQTLLNWCEKHPEFFDAVKLGEVLRTAKLEEDLLGATEGPKVTSRIFALKNAAPDEWRDKREVEHQGGLTITLPPDSRDL
jgi:DNA-binding XRE family transcriptional regulator